jgi:hypothetical protein
VKVRIKSRPAVEEIDGVDLRGMEPGSVREVSASTAAWLVAEGYALPEMRHEPTERERRHKNGPALPPNVAHDRRRRRS